MAPPVVVEMGAEIPAPPEVVWERLVDWERLGEWMREASEFRVTTRHREGVGVEASATIRIAGITTVDRVMVSRWEPPLWFGIAHLGWVKGSGLIHVRPTGRGTSWLWWRESLEPPLGWLGWAGLTALRPVMAATFNRDLRLLGDIVGGARSTVEFHE